MRTTGYKNNSIIALCYSVADRDSFKNIKEFWIPELNDSNCNRKPFILVATKTDLRTDNRDYVSTVEGEILAKEIGAERFMECSAFYKDSVHTVFHFIATASPQHKKKRSVIYRIFGR